MIAFSCLAFLSLDLAAQHVGINNVNPSTALDVNGQIRLRPEVINIGGQNTPIPNNRMGYYRLNSSTSTSFTFILPPVIEGGLLLIENNSNQVAQALGNVSIQPRNSRLFLGSSSGWIQAHEIGGLEKITENSITGWRLVGRDPENYGDIGENAVDFSTSTGFPSNTNGATGASSFAAGSFTTAGGVASSAFGTGSRAFGAYSTAMGLQCTAQNFSSVALGNYTQANGQSSIALNEKSLAVGQRSAALGFATHAKASTSLAIGQFNDTIASSNASLWIDTDPVFMIGNGTSEMNRTNALTVFKNGNTDVTGFTRLGRLAEGAPRIKVKRLSGTLNGVGNATIAHGVTTGKILGLEARVTNQFGSLVFGGNTIPNNSFNAFVSGSSVLINAVAGSNGDIINQAFTILLTYEE